jgi:hypothetical protein
VTEGETEMTTPRRSIKSSLMLGAIVATAGATFVVPSVASAATTTTPSTPSTPATSTDTPKELPARYQRACLRIPNLQIRINNFIDRLNGDASTRGSLLWLQAQIDNAKSKGRTQLATVLENRLKVRQQTLVVLNQRQERLTKLLELCRNHGVDV